MLITETGDSECCSSGFGFAFGSGCGIGVLKVEFLWGLGGSMWRREP